MLSYVLHPSLLWAGLIVMLFLFVACAAVYCITIITRWRLRQYRIAYIQRDKLEMATHIKDIASNPAWWTQIRKRACKELRLIELSSQDIEDLELLVKSEQDQAFQRELERTVYELQARVREKDREGKLLDEKALKKKHARTLANQGLDYRREKRYQEAIDAFNQALSLDEGNVDFITERGVTYGQMKQYQKALEDFDRVILLDEKATRALLNRAWTYRQMQRFQDAVADFTRIIAYREKDIATITHRGEVYRQMGCYQDALADFSLAIAIDKKYIPALAERALTYRKMERFQEALEDFTRIIALNEKGSWTIAQRGIIYLLTGRYYEEALSDFNRAIALNEKSYWYHYCRSLVYLATGKANEFESELNCAVDLIHVRLGEAVEDRQVSLGFDLALFKLVGGNALDTESHYDRLATTCSSWSQLQEAVDDLNDFLLVLPSNQVAPCVRTRLEARIHELKGGSM